MTTSAQQPDSSAFQHFLTEVERLAAQLNEQPGRDDPVPDVTDVDLFPTSDA